MAHRRKAGRKKKQGPRTASGKPSRAWQTIARDFGTLELQRKRRELVGENADPDLSATAVGVLYAHGCLDECDHDGKPIPDVGQERYNAALRYATLAAAIYGPRWPGNGSGREIAEVDWIELKLALERIERRLSYLQRQSLDRTVRANWQPTWFQMQRLGKPLTTEDELERQELISALDAIRGQHRMQAAAA